MEPPLVLHYPRPCGCKGIRRCLTCESDFGADVDDDRTKTIVDDERSFCSFVFCTHCSTAYFAQMEDYEEKDCGWHERLGNVPSLAFPGVAIFTEFISPEAEADLAAEIDSHPWAKSQSGRLKQDYGPKCNFKKRKLKLDAFTGFPSYLRPIVARFPAFPLLADYHTVEQCNLEYEPARGSAIDPHFDDFWIWGERLLTLSLLSLTFLTMSLPPEDAPPKVGDEAKARLAAERRKSAERRWAELVDVCGGIGGKASSDDDTAAESCKNDDKDDVSLSNDIRDFPASPAGSASAASNSVSASATAASNSVSAAASASASASSSSLPRRIPASTPLSSVRVHLPMPPRSMMLLHGPARDTWVHEVRRGDIKERRIAVAFRELAEEFLPGGKSEEVGKQVLDRAARFDGVSRIEC